MQPEILRIADSLLAVFWIWALVVTVKAGRIGGDSGFKNSRTERPGQYWFLVFIMALMVLHFGGLAIVGNKAT